jgi:hypothetical protein
MYKDLKTYRYLRWTPQNTWHNRQGLTWPLQTLRPSAKSITYVKNPEINATSSLVLACRRAGDKEKHGAAFLRVEQATPARIATRNANERKGGRHRVWLVDGWFAWPESRRRYVRKLRCIGIYKLGGQPWKVTMSRHGSQSSEPLSALNPGFFFSLGRTPVGYLS